MIRLISLVVALIYFGDNPVKGQFFTQTHWHFGETSKGLFFDYDTNIPSVTNDSYTPFTNEGCGVLNDPFTGQLKFYTDGLKVIDANGQVMPNGANLSGNVSTFGSGKIIPDPTNCDRYYIVQNSTDMSFTDYGELRYSVVDLTLPGNGSISNPLGDVVVGEKNILIANSYGEALEVVPQSNSRNSWLITSSNTNSTISVFQLNQWGIELSATYPVGFNLTDMRCIRISPDFTKGVICSLKENQATVIFGFNPVTGEIINTSTMPGTPMGNNNGWYGIFDAEWSSDGTKLFLSKYRTQSPASGGKLFQYDFNNPSVTPVLIHQISTSATNMGRGLRRGPDDKIYWLYHNPTTNNSQYIGVVNLPNQIGAAANFQAVGINMGATLGLAHLFPSFPIIKNTVPEPLLVSENLQFSCTDSNIQYVLNIDDEFQDSEGDNLIITAASTDIGIVTTNGQEILYTAPNGYVGNANIQIQICDDYCFPLCTNLEISLEISLIGSESDPLQNEYFQCNSEPISVGYEIPGFEYLWSTGETTSEIILTEPGEYTYYAYNESGCEVLDTIQVLNVELINDLLIQQELLICDNSSILLSTEITNADLLWSTGSTDSSIEVSAAGDYILTATFEGNCEVQDTISVVVQSPQQAVLTPFVESCATHISVTDFGFPIIWSTGDEGAEIIATESGTYEAQVYYSQLCYDVVAIFVDVYEFETPASIFPEELIICTENSFALGYSLEGFQYLWSTGETSSTIIISEPGEYIYYAFNDVGCEVSDTVQVVSSAFIENLIIDEEIFTCPGTPVVLSTNVIGAQLNWSTGENSATIEVSEGGLYVLTAIWDQTCELSDTVLVSIESPPNIALTNQEIFCVTYISTPNLGFPINWSTGEHSSQIIAENSGTYEAEVFYSENCSVVASLNVEVPEHAIPDIIFPNIFTPNDDANNDYYKLFPNLGECFDLIDFKIYNRWGSLLFETDDKDFVWSGALKNGEFISQGIYFCTAKYILKGEEVSIEFNLQVLR